MAFLKTEECSHTLRRSLVNEEVNVLQDQVVSRLEELGVEIR